MLAQITNLLAISGASFRILPVQLMTGSTDNNKGGNREQEIASISRALKGVAKELDIPVIALAQLSRAVETRGGDKKPMLSDLRESGAIEQDADVVMFLHRDRGISDDGEGPPEMIETQLIVAKQRNGPVGTIKLAFIPHFTKFEPLTYQSP